MKLEPTFCPLESINKKTAYFLSITPNNTIKVTLDESSRCAMTLAGLQNANSFDQFIRVNPNPFTDELSVELKGMPENAQLRIIDALGRPVFEKMNLSNGTITINGSKLSSGVYYVEVTSGNYKSLEKIIKL